jgi:DNA ligase-1
VRAFADLFDAIDRTTSTTAKVDAMVDYFRQAEPADAAWGVYVLSGRKLKRLVGSRLLRDWAAQVSGTPAWLFDECYSVVGDLAETVALLVRPAPGAAADDLPLHRWFEQRLLPLRDADAPAQRQAVVSWWNALPTREVFVLNKLLTGSLRVGVSQTLVERALARVAGLEPSVIAHRLAGHWPPTAEFYQSLIAPGDAAQGPGTRPYPFYLASPVEEAGGVTALGDPAAFLAEWKFDGIRAQLVRRAGRTDLWSRGDERLTDRFPEILEAAARLNDDAVIDGEILIMRDATPLPFAVLQKRINRLRPGRAALAAAPAAMIAYDLLELGSIDLRDRPLIERRAGLERLIAAAASPRLLISEALRADGWAVLGALRDDSRSRNVEGLMLKRLDSPYLAGRRRGAWWKWKIDPLTIDAVLVYAQPGHGRRAGLLTDYTFALWDTGRLVPFAKAYSGLTQAEIDELDAWIRRNTSERFGPVRAVEPSRVFELGFEGVQVSDRHKAGVAVRFPRILRFRTDKRPEDADTLDALRRLAPPNDAPRRDASDQPTLFD